MKLSWTRVELHPAVPFTIARGTATSYQRLVVRLADDARGLEGWGEAAPNAFYHESGESAHEALAQLAGSHADILTSLRLETLADAEALETVLLDAIPSAASVRAAVSSAAHDLLGRALGQPVHALLGLDPNAAPPTSFTIAIPPNDSELVRRVEAAHAYPILKIKLGTDRDEWIVRQVRRAAPRKVLRVDANAAWSVEQAAAMMEFLAGQGVELVEQPLARHDLDGFRRLRERASLPIIADESCVDSRDIPALADAVDGINIKLAKCGGLGEARRMASDARARGMKVMLGCMIESSLGITAAAHLAPLADYADLDGAALLADDPFVGATIDDGMVRLPPGHGLGVRRRD